MFKFKFQLVKDIEKKRLNMLRLKKNAEKLVQEKKIEAIKKENQAERALSKIRARYRLKSAISKKAMEDAQEALIELKKAQQILKDSNWIKEYRQAKEDLLKAEDKLKKIIK